MNLMDMLGRDLRAKCYCETCGELFLDIPLNQFIKESAGNNPNIITDRFCVFAVEHKIHNPDHKIMQQAGPVTFESEDLITQAEKSSLEDIEKFKEYVEQTGRPF